MAEKELFTKNMKLSAEFDLYVLEHPEVGEQIPENARIVFLPERDPKLCERNQELAKSRREPGQPVVFVQVEGVSPSRSRFVNPSVEVATF